MTRHPICCLIVLILSTHITACGAPSSANPLAESSDPITAKCALACRPGENSTCTGEDQVRCTKDCLTIVAGLAPLCQQYLLDGMRIEHKSCACSGTVCTLCRQDAYQSYDCDTQFCSFGCTPIVCDPVRDTKCKGLDMRHAITDKDATAFCSK